MFDQTAIAKADALIFWYGLEGESTRAKYKHFLAVQELSTNIIWSFIYDCLWLCSCNTCCSREQRVSFVSIWLHPFLVLIMLENRVRTTVISLFWQQKITLLDMCNVQYTYLMCFCLGKISFDSFALCKSIDISQLWYRSLWTNQSSPQKSRTLDHIHVSQVVKCTCVHWPWNYLPKK